jgi:hypothetical protein
MCLSHPRPGDDYDPTKGVGRGGGGLPPARSADAASHGCTAPRFKADRPEREKLAARFFEGLREGDVDGLREAQILMALNGFGWRAASAIFDGEHLMVSTR